MKKWSLLCGLLLLAGVAGAQPTVGFFTGSGNGWTNYIFAGVSTPLGPWSTAIIYDTKRTLSNDNVVCLSWDRSVATNLPVSSIGYTVYFGNLDTGGPTNSLDCATNRYAVFFNFQYTNRTFFFVKAKDLTDNVESLPSNLLIAPPVP